MRIDLRRIGVFGTPHSAGERVLETFEGLVR